MDLNGMRLICLKFKHFLYKTECMIFGTTKRLNALNGRQLAFSVNGTLINTMSSYKYLGVTLDSSLHLESQQLSVEDLIYSGESDL